MKNRIATLFLFCCFYAGAQTSHQEVINIAGGTFQQGYYQFEWSVGELALINKMQSPDDKFVITNGFFQPYLLYPVRDNYGNGFGLEEIRIFPNPATTYVEINFFTKQKGKIVLSFFDALGRLSHKRELKGNGIDLIERVSVTSLAQGTYLLTVELIPEPGSVAKKSTYKFIKAE